MRCITANAANETRTQQRNRPGGDGRGSRLSGHARFISRLEEAAVEARVYRKTTTQTPDALELRSPASRTFGFFLDWTRGTGLHRGHGHMASGAFQCLARRRQHPLATVVPEQAVVPDLGEALGQDMQGEAMGRRDSMAGVTEQPESLCQRRAGVPVILPV